MIFQFVLISYITHEHLYSQCYVSMLYLGHSAVHVHAHENIRDNDFCGGRNWCVLVCAVCSKSAAALFYIAALKLL